MPELKTGKDNNNDHDDNNRNNKVGVISVFCCEVV